MAGSRAWAAARSAPFPVRSGQGTPGRDRRSPGLRTGSSRSAGSRAGLYLRDPGGFRQLLRPACRRCTARLGITGPIACRLPPHQTLCRRHRLWTGPAARTHAAQLDISQLPEILQAQRRHHAQLHDHPWQDVEAAISHATRAIYQALRGGTWIPGQRQRLHQLAPGTWARALAGVLGGCPGRADDSPAHAIVEIAIYPDVAWLAARILREHSTSHRAAS
jgi:hypothetical protein